MTTPVMATQWWWTPGGTSLLRLALEKRLFMLSLTWTNSLQHGLRSPLVGNAELMSTGSLHRQTDLPGCC